jgi:hypothetical protein
MLKAMGKVKGFLPIKRNIKHVEFAGNEAKECYKMEYIENVFILHLHQDFRLQP